MIRYTLACDQGHEFESWFQNSDAYDKQAKRHLVACPHCNSTKVGKALMTPQLTRKQNARTQPVVSNEPAANAEPASSEVESTPAPSVPVAIMSEQEREFRAKLKELRDHLVANSDNVGKKFPEEARRMHYGEIEHRSIYGEASPDEAKALHEEGIEFHPLPPIPEERN